MTVSAASTSQSRTRDSLTDLQRSVLLTILYADLFDFALTDDELERRLVLTEAEPDVLKRCVASLADVYLTRTAGYTVWKGREHLIDLRRHRSHVSRELWPTAERYARWLARVPFVRMVAVSGSLAADNADSHSDVDLFCITDDRRLWLARLFIVCCSKTTRLFPSVFPRYLCPNYLLTTGSLEILDQNLFTAHEVAQAVPLYGADEYRKFLQANGWIRAYLPAGPAAHPVAAAEGKAPYSNLVERLLGGRLGDRIDDLIFRAFRTFYRKRALRYGWSWGRLERAYERSRYIVPEQGYVPVVRRLLEQRIEMRLGASFCVADGKRLFPSLLAEAARQSVSDPLDDGRRCVDWEAQFRRDYGVYATEDLAAVAAVVGGPS